MKLQLPPMASDITICLYVITTLFIRFKLENQNPISPLHSIVLGFCFITIIWVLIKFKVLNPNWFGFFGPKKSSKN